MNRVFILLFFILFSNQVVSGVSVSGVINRLYADASGNIAVKIDDGYSAAASECPSNNGWAGKLSADPVLKSALIAAKASGSKVTLSIVGCENNGAWLKLNAIYID